MDWIGWVRRGVDVDVDVDVPEPALLLLDLQRKGGEYAVVAVAWESGRKGEWGMEREGRACGEQVGRHAASMQMDSHITCSCPQVIFPKAKRTRH